MFDSNLTIFVWKDPNDIGSGNIFAENNDTIYWHIYDNPGLNNSMMSLISKYFNKCQLSFPRLKVYHAFFNQETITQLFVMISQQLV